MTTVEPAHRVMLLGRWWRICGCGAVRQLRTIQITNHLMADTCATRQLFSVAEFLNKDAMR